MNETLPKPANSDSGLRGTALKRAPELLSVGQETAALDRLCRFLNNPAVSGAESEQSSSTLNPSSGTQMPTDPALQLQPVIVHSEAAAPALIPTGLSFTKLFFTGRLGVGKDYVASKIGAEIHGFSEPLYALASHFFGIPVDANTNKDLPGIREFLQRAGMWGRRHISKDYPLTTERAAFSAMIREHGARHCFKQELGVDWGSYGTDANLWLNAALVRIAISEAPRVAITNVRFDNEFKSLSENGFVNWHVMANPKELEARQLKRGIQPGSAVLKDTSEALADKLDRQVIATVSKQRVGPKLRVIWNSDVPAPSNRLWTLQEFITAAQPAVAAQE